MDDLTNNYDDDLDDDLELDEDDLELDDDDLDLDEDLEDLDDDEDDGLDLGDFEDEDL